MILSKLKFLSHLQQVLTSLEKMEGKKKCFLQKNSKGSKIDLFRELTLAGNRQVSTFSS